MGVTCRHANHVDDLVRLAHHRKRDLLQLELVALYSLKVEDVVDQRQQVIRAVCICVWARFLASRETISTQ